MRFHVVGADKETGNDIEVDVTAVDRAEAEIVATKRGVLVSEVQAIKDADPDPIAMDDLDLADSGKGAKPEKPAAGTVAAVEVDPAFKQNPSMASTTGAKAAPAAGASVAGASVAGAASPSASQVPSSGDTQAHGIDSHPTAAQGAHMEYHVIMNQSLYLLEVAVNKHVKAGWEPQGGLCIATWNNAMQYFQAVIRHKD